jgi:sigma-54 dependent transcriptional regulator, acetoin dehydrogenase operon transcriptional activator AcoR
MALQPSPSYEAWRRYASTGALAHKLLRAPVYRAWERSHLQGANPRLPRAEALSPLDTEQLLQRQQAMLHAAHPFLRALSAAAGGERHAAMLSDSQAVVLEVLGDEASVHGPERVPGPGALLSEAVCGANGLGTPLAEGSYVELVGPEHFIQGFHLFTCQGIPLRAPGGEVAGVLSTSVRRPDASGRLREILLCAAHGIEAELLRERLERDLKRVLEAAPDEAGSLERLRQDVMQAQATARVRLLSAARVVARSLPQQDLRLVHEATLAIDTFRRRAELWRMLASEEQQPPRSVDLQECLRDLVDLLETELRVRQARLQVEGESTPLLADPHRLYQQLFRGLMQALEHAGEGGSVRACVWQGSVVLEARSATEHGPVAWLTPLLTPGSMGRLGRRALTAH